MNPTNLNICKCGRPKSGCVCIQRIEVKPKIVGRSTRNITIDIEVDIWRDKKTDCIIYYSKKYDISSYGKTKEEAEAMFEFCVKDILLHTRPKKVKK